MAQTAFSHNIEYFCFLRCLLDRGRVSVSAVNFFAIAEKLLDHRNNLRAFFILLCYDSS
nr:MAG TPA: hypothetical protein [Caudoviricetes sp.]